jgi:hypothetical protein
MLFPLGQAQNIINVLNKFKEQKGMLRVVTFFIIAIYSENPSTGYLHVEAPNLLFVKYVILSRFKACRHMWD